MHGCGITASMLIGSPLILVESKDRCWKCHTVQRVVALASSRISDGDMDSMSGGFINDPFLLRNIETLPAELAGWFAANEPHFHPFFSKRANMKYFTNLCPQCGANFGDHFLHESGDAFSPQTPEEAARLSIRTLPVQGEFQVRAGYVSGAGALILQFAKQGSKPSRVATEPRASSRISKWWRPWSK